MVEIMRKSRQLWDRGKETEEGKESVEEGRTPRSW